ncbi:MAG: DUF1428 domain-containing protein [Pseudomonadota bacterium]
MSYVESFLMPVPSDQRAAYLTHAGAMGEEMKTRGALLVSECWGTNVPDGTLTSMPLAVKLEAGETVVFGWVVWPDRATRDAAWEAMMADETLAAEMRDMPFDGRRMIFGGFEMILDL